VPEGFVPTAFHLIGKKYGDRIKEEAISVKKYRGPHVSGKDGEEGSNHV